MNQYDRIFVEFSIFRPAIENRGFKQIKKFLRRFTPHNMEIYLSEKKKNGGLVHFKGDLDGTTLSYATSLRHDVGPHLHAHDFSLTTL